MNYSQSYAATDSRQANDEQNQRKQRWLLPILLLVLLILLLVTTFLLVQRLGIYAANEMNAIFLVQPNPGFSVEDQEQVWDSETKINIFKSEYDGIGRDITVQSANGDRLIAPGTEGEYTFTLKNTGNVNMDYSVKFAAELYVDGNVIALEDFPLGIRLRQSSGEYLLGDGDTWVEIHLLDEYLATDTLAVNHYAWYTFEWKWLFEEYVVDDHDRLQLEKSDALDTLLGNISSETPISLSISISTSAEPSENTSIDGNEHGNSHGSIWGWFPWIILLLLIAITVTAIAFGYVFRKNQKHNADDSEDSLDDETDDDYAGGEPIV